jgi:hypothetical protein
LALWFIVPTACAEALPLHRSDGMPAVDQTIASSRDGPRAADTILLESALLY